MADFAASWKSLCGGQSPERNHRETDFVLALKTATSNSYSQLISTCAQTILEFVTRPFTSAQSELCSKRAVRFRLRKNFHAHHTPNQFAKQQETKMMANGVSFIVERL
jgi:hypothetical protein